MRIVLSLVLIFISACEQLSTNPAADPIAFKGIKSIDLTQNGGLVLSWDQPLLGTVTAYEIYQQELKLESTQAQGLRLSSSAADDSESGLTKVLLNIPDAQAPVKQGKLLKVVSGDRNFFELSFLKPGAYGFQIRAVDSNGLSDLNQRVFLLNLERSLGYPGISKAEIVDGRIRLEWPALETSLKGSVQYTVFLGEAFSKSVAITTGTTIDIDYRGERPGTNLVYGVRSTDPKGRTDNNTETKSVIVPEASSSFEGCLTADARGADRILVRYQWPEDEYEYFRIYRNGIQIFATKDKGLTEYLDIGLQEGETYEYSCIATFKELNLAGTKTIKVQTLNSNSPKFEGIRDVQILSAHKARVRWGVSSGVPTAKFQIFANPGSQVNWEQTPLAEVGPELLEVELSNLGDDLDYAFGVRACSQKQICDLNEVTLNARTPDNGAPKTPGVTQLGVMGGILHITAPWQPSMGGIAKRQLYIKEDGNATPNIDDYRLVSTLVVTNPATPPTLLTFNQITDNTHYHVVVRDLDSKDQTQASWMPVSLRTGDTTPPVFTGVSSLAKGTVGAEQTTLTAVFSAIAPETSTNKYGASAYQVYILQGSGNACRAGVFHQSVPAASYTTGQDVRLEVSNLQPLTLYSLCVKAVDAAGNVSVTDVSLSRSTLDTQAPVFDGLQSMVFDRTKSELVLTWNPASASDLYEYQIRIWKNDANPDNVPNTVVKRLKIDANQGTRVANSLVNFGSQELIYVVVNACDNAGVVDGGSQNCTTFAGPDAKSLQLDDVAPPAGFIGIRSEPDLETPQQGSVIVRWVAPQTWDDYRGFRIYFFDTATQTLSEVIKDCPCSANNCPNQLTQCQVDGLNAFRTYVFHVRAYDAAGNITQLDPLSYSTSKRTSDTVAPDFNSGLTLVYNAGTSTLSWSAATDNQYPQEPNATILYEIYRKVDTTFASATNPAADPGSSLMATLVERTWLDAGTDYVSGKSYFYAVCAKDGSGNRNCDGNIKSYSIPDLTPPTISSFTTDKTSDSPVWTLAWAASDNKTANNNLIVRVYKKVSNDPSDKATTADELIVNNTGVFQSPNLNGPLNQDIYVHYLLRVQDTDGNVATRTLTVLSTNAISLTSIRSNEGPTLGNNLLMIVGEGFKPNVTVKIGNADCLNLTRYSRRHLMCRAPAGNLGTYDVVVTNPEGSSATLAGGYNYCNPQQAGSCQNICNLPAQWGPRFAKGAGATAADPYVICTPDHLSNIRTQGHGRFYAFGQNIDLSGLSFLPITNSGQWDFRGTIEGNNYAVLNWSFENINQDFIGLFKIINFADIKNLGLINFNVRGRNMVGTLAGSGGTDTNGNSWSIDQTTVSGIFATGTVTGADLDAGGIIGRAYHNAFNLMSFVNVEARRVVGGIFGRKLRGGNTFSSFGSIKATGASTECYVGGIAGYWDAGNFSINQVEASGTVRCTDDANLNAQFAGGLFGYIRSTTLTNASSTADVQGKLYVGGISGFALFTTAQTLKASGTITARQVAGGIMGEMQGSTVQGCESSASVSATLNYIGGISGRAYTNGNISRIESCTFTGIVNATSGYAGGILGYGDSFELKSSTSKGRVEGSQYLGGLVAEMRRATILNSVANVSLLAPAGDYIGGLVGAAWTDGTGSTITGSSATGLVIGRSAIGGLVGGFRGVIENSFARVDVTGNDSVGGLAGALLDADTNRFNLIRRSYATGSVLAVTRGAGLVGWVRGFSQIRESYASGPVESSTYAGGFIAQITNNLSTIELNYATGSVKGNNGIGGFLGVCLCNNSNQNIIRDSYATGRVIGNQNVGGFAGQSGDIFLRVISTGRVDRDTSETAIGGLIGAFWNPDGPRNVPDGFWDKDTSGRTSSAGGQGRSTTEMFGSSLYTNYDATLWKFNSLSYPMLQWQFAAP
jgi:hypothetical protein